MKSYNNNRTVSIPTTTNEEKALALLLYFGTPYFISNAGSLLMGTEEDAKEAYSLYLDTISPDMDDEGREPLKSFEEWADETIEHVNTDEIIASSGLNVCTESDQEPCKNVIDTQVINNTTYYICKRENVTNNATEQEEDTTPDKKFTGAVEIDNIDFKMLRAQKRALLSIPAPHALTTEQYNAIDGMIVLCDHLQDYAIDVLGMDKYEILDLTSDEDDEEED